MYKIAYCLPVLRSPNSSDTSFLQQRLIADGLKARGHALTYLMPQDLSNIVSTTDFKALSLVPRTWSKAGWFELTSKATWRMQQLLRVPYLNVFSNYRYMDAYLQCLPGHDIVQERNGLYKSGVAMACQRLKLPYIFFFDGDELYEHEFAGEPIKGLLNWRAQQLTRYNLNAADRILCVSNSAKKRLVTVLGVPEAKVAVFPNAVDVNLYHPNPEKKVHLRRSLSIGDNPLVVFVGGFFHWHDISGLLDAFVIVLQRCPQARLILIGDGIHYEAMIQHANELQIDSYVRFTGSIPHSDIPDMINAADIAVAPYLENPQLGLWGSPMKLFEYMACSAPVVASNLGQISEVIQDGYNGLLTPASDVPALANAILKLIENPDLRARLGQQARRDVLERYTWDTYIKRLESLYASVVEEHSHKSLV